MRLWIILLILSQMKEIESHRNWIKWFQSLRIVKMELLKGRGIGLGRKVPTGFNVITDGIKYQINANNQYDFKNHGPKEADLIKGKGLVLNGTLKDPIYFSIGLPQEKKQSNICGLVLTSFTDVSSAYIANLKVFWKSDNNDAWDAITVPVTGDFTYILKLQAGLNTRVILFDTVPALHLAFEMSTIPGFNVNFRLGVLNQCIFPDTVKIVDCSEKIDKNPRFYRLPHGVPLNIQCPVDCMRSWPCWGFKVFSTDSPICWAATLNFGRWGDGSYTLYKLPMVAQFQSEVNPTLNHGIFCRRSIVVYPGFTFDRKYYDMAKIAYRDTMGA